jgi:hypothetical protein
MSSQEDKELRTTLELEKVKEKLLQQEKATK